MSSRPIPPPPILDSIVYCKEPYTLTCGQPNLPIWAHSQILPTKRYALANLQEAKPKSNRHSWVFLMFSLTVCNAETPFYLDFHNIIIFSFPQIFLAVPLPPPMPETFYPLRLCFNSYSFSLYTSSLGDLIHFHDLNYHQQASIYFSSTFSLRLAAYLIITLGTLTGTSSSVS